MISTLKTRLNEADFVVLGVLLETNPTAFVAFFLANARPMRPDAFLLTSGSKDLRTAKNNFMKKGSKYG